MDGAKVLPATARAAFLTRFSANKYTATPRNAFLVECQSQRAPRVRCQWRVWDRTQPPWAAG